MYYRFTENCCLVNGSGNEALFEEIYGLTPLVQTSNRVDVETNAEFVTSWSATSLGSTPAFLDKLA